MNHFKGPWHVAENKLSVVAQNPNTLDFNIICHAKNNDDAKFIAAAPDLLEALETANNFITVYLSKHNGMIGKEWEEAMKAGIQQMNSAIAKAK